MQPTIKQVVILGSGVMGSRIACHFAGIGVQVLLLDRLQPGTEESTQGKERNKLVNDALQAAIKSNPNDPDRNVWPIFIFSLSFRPRRVTHEESNKAPGHSTNPPGAPPNSRHGAAGRERDSTKCRPPSGLPAVPHEGPVPHEILGSKTRRTMGSKNPIPASLENRGFHLPTL